jgi:hypothetical protein
MQYINKFKLLQLNVIHHINAISNIEVSDLMHGAYEKVHTDATF